MTNHEKKMREIYRAAASNMCRGEMEDSMESEVPVEKNENAGAKCGGSGKVCGDFGPRYP